MEFLTAVVQCSCACILQSVGQVCSIRVAIPLAFSMGGVDGYEGGVPDPMVRTHLEHCVQLRHFQHRQGHVLVAASPEEGCEDAQGDGAPLL